MAEWFAYYPDDGDTAADKVKIPYRFGHPECAALSACEALYNVDPGSAALDCDFKIVVIGPDGVEHAFVGSHSMIMQHSVRPAAPKD